MEGAEVSVLHGQMNMYSKASRRFGNQRFDVSSNDAASIARIIGRHAVGGNNDPVFAELRARFDHRSDVERGKTLARITATVRAIVPTAASSRFLCTLPAHNAAPAAPAVSSSEPAFFENFANF